MSSYPRVWGEWGPWQVCSGDYCGLGKRSRIRKQIIKQVYMPHSESAPWPQSKPPKGKTSHKKNLIGRKCVLLFCKSSIFDSDVFPSTVFRGANKTSCNDRWAATNFQTMNITSGKHYEDLKF